MDVCIYYQGTERVNRGWVVYLTSVSAVTNRHKLSVLKCHTNWDFPGGPVVKTHASTARGEGSIPGWGTKILHATWCGPKKKIFFKKINLCSETKKLP